jgi:hypothetical protein
MVAVALGASAVTAQETGQPDAALEADPLLSAEALDDLVAPVALYPDALLAQVFVAATYPLEIVKADRWVAENAALEGEDRTSAAEAEGWDPELLPRWDDFTRFLEDGRVCLTNNAAERALRGVALGRKAWLFAGSERGGHRAALMYTLVVTAKMNGADPQAWLADVLGRIASMPMDRLDELLPWNWVAAQHSPGVKAA